MRQNAFAFVADLCVRRRYIIKHGRVHHIEAGMSTKCLLLARLPYMTTGQTLRESTLFTDKSPAKRHRTLFARGGQPVRPARPGHVLMYSLFAWENV